MKEETLYEMLSDIKRGVSIGTSPEQFQRIFRMEFNPLKAKLDKIEAMLVELSEKRASISDKKKVTE